jgi:2-hydroxy-3-keto-5-methylthiopentenyl-1-phosphate phosphatase
MFSLIMDEKMWFPEPGAYQEIAVLSDFDGVLTNYNVLELLYEEYSQVDWQHYVSLWEREELSAVEEIPLCLEGVMVDRTRMESFINGISLANDFRILYDFCQSKNHYLAIVSDGLRWYIEYLLQQAGISNLPIFANEIQFTDQGLSFSFPWYDETTPLTGTSKASIIRRFQGLGYRVLLVGDGLSDVEGAKIADIVYAKGYLFEWMKKEDRNVNEFSGFADLTESLLTKL